MRILVVHERYRTPGGEDRVVEEERRMLVAHGHEVATLEASNDVIGRTVSAAGAAARAVYSAEGARRVRAALGRFRADVVHVHNFFPLLSPSVHYEARRAGAAVVQTVHNYRLLCPGGLLFRDGHPCAECVGRPVPWPAVVHGCYRGSRVGTAAVAAMVGVHRALGTWRRAVDLFIAPTRFVRDRAVEAGLPADAIVVKPHFTRERGAPGDGGGGFVLAVGRVAAEKGLETLLAAWERVGRGGASLKIVGEGPLRERLQARWRELAGVEWLGSAAPERVRALMEQAALLVVPSRWYEAFGLVVIEAFAAGLPVVVSGHGALAELVDDGRTGRHVPPGDPGALASALSELLARPGQLLQMRGEARGEFERWYGEDRNHELLMAAYARALQAREAPRGAAPALEEEHRWNRSRP